MEGGGTLSKIKFNDSQNKNENKQFSKHFRKMAAIDYFTFIIKSKGLYQTETGGKAWKVSSPIDQFPTTTVYILAENPYFPRRPTQEKSYFCPIFFSQKMFSSAQKYHFLQFDTKMG